MYNRYIPQSDGSYQRRSMPDRSSRPPAPPPPPEPPRQEACPEPPPASCEDCPKRPSGRKEQPRSCDGFGFLRNLLPGNFDVEDLMIVVLLLLMSGDCREEQNLPLLTLALYLFL